MHVVGETHDKDGRDLLLDGPICGSGEGGTIGSNGRCVAVGDAEEAASVVNSGSRAVVVVTVETRAERGGSGRSIVG